ncbi:MAG TPA: HD-GYP domain-containing protein [Rhodocyclaceae bacterium]
MLKKISSQHLRPGMYLQELCGSWMEHPFWRTSFLLEDAKDVRRVIESGITEVWIDVSKGLDAPEHGQAPEDAREEVEQELIAAVSEAPKPVERVSMAHEVARAAKICAKAKEAVTTMFQEARMGKAISANDAAPLVEEISASVMRNPGAVISLARLKTKDDYTYMHSVAVCALMVALAKQLGLDAEQTRKAGMAGLLHDVGKMMIPLEVLNKPGKLTDEEFATVKAHPAEGHKMLLSGEGVDDIALDVCLHHHEKIDGSGYPERLAGEQISLFARMGAVCDVYDAITSNRPYKAGWSPAESLRKMAEWCKGHFDETIFKAFVKSVGIYPIGTLVRLESGRLAVVMDQSEKSLLTPKIKVFYSTKSKARIPPEIVDLSRPGVKEKIAAYEDPSQWGIPDLDALWQQAAAD